MKTEGREQQRTGNQAEKITCKDLPTDRTAKRLLAVDLSNFFISPSDSFSYIFKI